MRAHIVLRPRRIEQPPSHVRQSVAPCHRVQPLGRDPRSVKHRPGQLSRDRRRCIRVLAQVRRQQHGRAEVIARDPAHTDSGDGSARVECPGKTIIASRSCNPASRSRMPLCHSTSASSSPSNRLLASAKVSASLATASPLIRGKLRPQ